MQTILERALKTLDQKDMPEAALRYALPKLSTKQLRELLSEYLTDEQKRALCEAWLESL